MTDFGVTIDLYRSVMILAALAVITLTKGPQDKYYLSQALFTMRIQVHVTYKKKLFLSLI